MDSRVLSHSLDQTFSGYITLYHVEEFVMDEMTGGWMVDLGTIMK
jgi:hypothetical protein